MIHINGKKLFIIGFTCDINEDHVVICKLTDIRPRIKADTVYASDFYVVRDVCNKLETMYREKGYPTAKAVPVNNKTFNRDFGIKLAKKKLFRKIFRDIDKVVAEAICSHKTYVDQLLRLNAYMCGIASRTDYSIYKMNVVAAKLEAEVEGQPFDPTMFKYDDRSGCMMFVPRVTTTVEDSTAINDNTESEK